jgi:prepilin peptidase CpaA
MLELLALVVFAGLLIYAACSDVATMTIPNWVSIALAALYPLAALASGASFGEIGAHVLFGFGVLLIAFVMFQFGILGGGDAKLISAAAVWTGAGAFAPFVLGTAIAGGVLALVLLIARARVRPGETRPAFVNRLLTPKGGVPYGVAIMTGGLAALHALPFSAMALTLP